jgi:hypothetical protein
MSDSDEPKGVVVGDLRIGLREAAKVAEEFFDKKPTLDGDEMVVWMLLRAALSAVPFGSAEGRLDVDRVARAYGLVALGESGLRKDGTPWPADVEWATRFVREYARLSHPNRSE